MYSSAGARHRTRRAETDEGSLAFYYLQYQSCEHTSDTLYLFLYRAHTAAEEAGSAAALRAAPVGSWAIAVCVCVNRLIYRYITVHYCTLIRVRTSARLGGALP